MIRDAIVTQEPPRTLTQELEHEAALLQIDLAFSEDAGKRAELEHLEKRIASEEASRGGWIYFVQTHHRSPIKVGWARNLDQRLRTLQIANWQKIKLVGAVPGTRGDEARVHRELAGAHRRGEWFDREPTLALLAELESGGP